jgi:hypothetical protein
MQLATLVKLEFIPPSGLGDRRYTPELAWEVIKEKDLEFERLKLLFDYTKFHIGLYTTVATIFGGLIAASDTVPFTFYPQLLFASVICICIAGIAGGTIASSIPA